MRAEIARALQSASVPETEWLSELQGMGNDGSLPSFLESCNEALAARLAAQEQSFQREAAAVRLELGGGCGEESGCLAAPIAASLALAYLLGLLAVE